MWPQDCAGAPERRTQPIARSGSSQHAERGRRLDRRGCLSRAHQQQWRASSLETTSETQTSRYTGPGVLSFFGCESPRRNTRRLSVCLQNSLPLGCQQLCGGFGSVPACQAHRQAVSQHTFHCTRRIYQNNIQADHHRVADTLLSHFFHCKIPSFTLPGRSDGPRTDQLVTQVGDKVYACFAFPSVHLHNPHPSVPLQHVAKASSKRVAATHPLHRHHHNPSLPSSPGCYASRPAPRRRKGTQTPQHASLVVAAMSEETPTNAPVDAQAVGHGTFTRRIACPY